MDLCSRESLQTQGEEARILKSAPGRPAAKSVFANKDEDSTKSSLFSQRLRDLERRSIQSRADISIRDAPKQHEISNRRASRCSYMHGESGLPAVSTESLMHPALWHMSKV